MAARAALQTGHRSFALVHLELVADAAHAAHARHTAQEIVELPSQDRSGEDHLAAFDAHLDGAGMRDRPADLRTHALGEHVVGRLFLLDARGNLVGQALGALLEIPALPRSGDARLPHEGESLVADERSAARAPPWVE